MCKFKVGDKVVPISKNGENVNESFVWRNRKKEYLIVSAIRSDGVIVCDNKKRNYVDGDHFEEKDLMLYFKSKRIKSLEKRVEEQQNEINELKVLVHQLRDNTTIVVKEDVKSNNELRAEVIEKAKSFIQHHKDENWEFAIAKEFNRVFAFNLKLKDNDFGFYQDESKIFNEHIGKAIALGRALNVDVSEFENVVQPDSIVLGMLVKDKNFSFVDASGTVCKFKKGSFCSNGYENENGSWNSFEYSEIIDDTNAIYNEVK